MRLRHIVLLLAAAACCAAAAPAPALADRSDEVIRDCYEDGKLDGHYSDDDLKEAEDDLPNDVDEYSDCRSVIRGARGRGKNGGGGGTGGVPGGGFRGGGTAGGDPALSTDSGAIAGSKEDLDALNSITGNRSRTKPRVAVGSGQPITPTSGAVSVGESSNDMPTPLLAALIAIAAVGALGAGFAAWRRRPQRLGPVRLRRG